MAPFGARRRLPIIGEMPSVPPPSSSPQRRREIVLDLEASKKGLRGRLGGGSRGYVRLHGAEITLFEPAAMERPLTLAAGYLTLAAVDRGASERGADHGRFVILRRMGPTQVLPREHGIEGWLWTARQGSALPALVDDGAPNVALLFTKPLDEDTVGGHFRPAWVRALADRSPLGTPAIPGLLVAVESAWAAEDAFRQFGVLNPLTDREVPPTMRRHLPGDRPADPLVRATEDVPARTSIAPPGLR